MITNSLAQFKHKPLDISKNYIRLIQLNPRTPNQQIHCTIKSFDRDDQDMPPFEALSYVWGPPDRLRTIYLNNRTFQIRENLWDFLDHASLGEISIWEYRKDRVMYQPHYLFIDQICIDQESITERNHQVRQMSAIYAEALRVVAWLGMGNDEISQDMDAIELFASGGTDDEFPPNDDMAIFKVSYWTRLWIVQEYMLAKELIIVCGNRGIPSDWFGSVLYDWNSKASLFNQEVSTAMFQAERLASGREMHYRRSRKEDFVTTLRDFSVLSCEIPQDRIFALLGLVDPQIRAKIQVNYNRSATEVLLDAFGEIEWTKATDYDWRAMYELMTLMGISKTEFIKQTLRWDSPTGVQARQLIEERLKPDFYFPATQIQKPSWGPG